LILASKSPRRRQLLAEAGYHFVVVPAHDEVESDVDPTLAPAELVCELARRKAEDVVSRIASGELDLADVERTARDEDQARVDSGSPPRLPWIVVGCDTVVECGGKILGKPEDREDARRMLEALRGQIHTVLSGLCLWALSENRPKVNVEATRLRMDTLDDEQIDEYLASGRWAGKAGAFGYQDRTGWIHVVEGSESNVVGLPLELLAAMLEGHVPPAPPGGSSAASG
jgi:septum formation protein